MDNISGTSRLQTIFLRAFRLQPAGSTPDQWPSPAILRRWLRKPPFRRALAWTDENRAGGCIASVLRDAW